MSQLLRSVEALRAFSAGGEAAGGEAAGARCELCGRSLPPVHEHLAADGDALSCACAACAILFAQAGAGGRRRIPRGPPRRVALAPDDPVWRGLELPVELAFVWDAGPAVRAAYPGPGGAIESLVERAAWEALLRRAPELAGIAPRLEAVLIDRRRAAARVEATRPSAWRLPIDRCYALAGRVRAAWRGLGGGGDVQGEVDRFLAELAAEEAACS